MIRYHLLLLVQNWRNSLEAKFTANSARIVIANSAGNTEAEKAPLFVARNLSSLGRFVRFIDFYYYCL